MNNTTNQRKKQVYTLDDLAKLDKAYLIPAEVAPLLGTTPYTICLMAAKPDTREMLGFPVMRIGTRTKIPRIPFLQYMGKEIEMERICAERRGEV